MTESDAAGKERQKKAASKIYIYIKKITNKIIIVIVIIIIYQTKAGNNKIRIKIHLHCKKQK